MTRKKSLLLRKFTKKPQNNTFLTRELQHPEDQTDEQQIHNLSKVYSSSNTDDQSREHLIASDASDPVPVQEAKDKSLLEQTAEHSKIKPKRRKTRKARFYAPSSIKEAKSHLTFSKSRSQDDRRFRLSRIGVLRSVNDDELEFTNFFNPEREEFVINLLHELSNALSKEDLYSLPVKYFCFSDDTEANPLLSGYEEDVADRVNKILFKLYHINPIPSNKLFRLKWFKEEDGNLVVSSTRIYIEYTEDFELMTLIDLNHQSAYAKSNKRFGTDYKSRQNDKLCFMKDLILNRSHSNPLVAKVQENFFKAL